MRRLQGLGLLLVLAMTTTSVAGANESRFARYGVSKPACQRLLTRLQGPVAIPLYKPPGFRLTQCDANSAPATRHDYRLLYQNASHATLAVIATQAEGLDDRQTVDGVGATVPSGFQGGILVGYQDTTASPRTLPDKSRRVESQWILDEDGKMAYRIVGKGVTVATGVRFMRSLHIVTPTR